MVSFSSLSFLLLFSLVNGANVIALDSYCENHSQVCLIDCECMACPIHQLDACASERSFMSALFHDLIDIMRLHRLKFLIR